MIGIPVFNEEKTIESVIASVFAQTKKHYTLREVAIYADACTDQTIPILRKLAHQNRRIRVVAGTKRIGKYLRMDQMFRDCDSDVLVVLDADIKLGTKDFLDRFIKAVLSDPEAKMVQAHQIFIRPTAFMAKVIYANFKIWDHVRWSIPKFQHATNFYGSAIAFQGDFARSLHIPPDLTDPHFFLYLSAAKHNGFAYSPEAYIYQTPIQTVTDFKKLLNRTLGKQDLRLEQRFGICGRDVYHVALRYKVSGVLKALYYEPLYTPLAVLFNLWMQKIPRHRSLDQTAAWQMLGSTKKIFS